MNEPDRDPQLTDAIGQLRDSPPHADLWPTIARQLRPRGTIVVRWPVALAAGLVLAIASAGTTAALLHTPTQPVIAAVGVAHHPSDSGAVLIPAGYNADDAALALAVGEVERIVRASMSRLDPEARTSVQQSLQVLDRAIAQAAARQQAAPADQHVAHYLTTTLRKKLQLLRNVRELTQERS